MRPGWRLALPLVLAVLMSASARPAVCEPLADITADGLYGAAETQAAIVRAHDANIDSLRDEIAVLSARIAAGEDRRDELTKAEEAMLSALSARDPDYAAKLKQLRLALGEQGLSAQGRGGLLGGLALRAPPPQAPPPGAAEREELAEARKRLEAEREREQRQAETREGFRLGGYTGASGPPRQRAVPALPSFPWPPPTPSERLNLTRSQILPASSANPSLAEVGARIVAALQAAGYSEFSFYSAPQGFAVVARLERIEPDGTPAPQQLRFLAPNADEPFSLAAYVTRLFFAPEGYYRQIVFAVTTDVIRPHGPAPSAAGAEAMLSGGADRLPAQFRSMPFTNDYQVAALIYEYQKAAGDGAVKALTPGRLDARTNLVRAGLYRQLVSNGG